MKKTALITGACINTGVAIVEKFASEGYDIVFTGRNQDSVTAAEARYHAKFPAGNIKGYVLSSLTEEGLADEQGVKALFEQLDQDGVFIETLVLNAADQGLGQKIFENELSDFVQVLHTNVVWNYCLCEQAAKRMKAHSGGNIVFVNSNTAYRAIPDRIAYVTSKGGQLGLMRALTIDLGKYGIRVNAVSPTVVLTEMGKRAWETPAGEALKKEMPSERFAEPEEVSSVIAFLCSTGASMITGHNLVIDGGYTIK